MPLSVMPAQHKMSTRRGLPAHGIRGSSHLDRCCPSSAATGRARSATASSSTKTRYNESRVLHRRPNGHREQPCPRCAMMAIVTDDPFAAAAASADRLTALTGPH